MQVKYNPHSAGLRCSIWELSARSGHERPSKRSETRLPQTPHIERHFTGTATVRDLVIGMSDGLTVPFALAAGLSGAVDTTGIIVTAGLAEIAAGSIALGLGGYLAAKSDAGHYEAERKREETEVEKKTAAEVAEVAEVFRSYGVTEDGRVPLACG